MGRTVPKISQLNILFLQPNPKLAIAFYQGFQKVYGLKNATILSNN